MANPLLLCDPPHRHVLSSPGRNVDKWFFLISLMPSITGNLSALGCVGTRSSTSSAVGGLGGMGVCYGDASGCCLGRQKLPDITPFSFGRHHPPCREQPPQVVRPSSPSNPSAKPLCHKAPQSLKQIKTRMGGVLLQNRCALQSLNIY